MNKAPVRILLVEDSPSDAALLRESLNEAEPGGFEISHVQTLAEGVKQLRHQPFDVLLLDLSLPDSTGRETFLRARAEAPQLPIVLMTGAGDETIGLEAVREGIQDYLVKGQVEGRQTARAIGYAIERKRAEAELQRARDELERRVAERTADLQGTVEMLRTEIGFRKEVEQALRESEERYRTLFEFAPVGISISNYRGDILAFNRRLCDMAGVTPAEALRDKATSFYVAAAERDRLMAQLRKAGKLEMKEAQLKRKDGTTLTGLLHMTELRPGTEPLVMTMVQDITEQERMQWHVDGVRRLLELFATRPSRKEYLESVVQLLRERCGCQCAGIRMLNQAGCLPYAAYAGYNREFLRQETRLCIDRDDCVCIRIFQSKPRIEDEEFVSRKGSFYCNRASRVAGRLCASAADWANVACLAARYESLAHAPIRYRGELLGTIHLADRRCDRFPAETISFIESVAPLVGEALHRFQVEESLQESERRFRSMFERHEAVMLLVEEKSGMIEDGNAAAAAFYGYSRERLRTMKIEDLNTLPAQDVARQRQRASRGDQNCFVFPHRVASGEVRTVEVHSTPIHLEGRSVLFSIIHDITERKLLEKQILDISEAERQRVGRDLHDSLGGMLTGAALMSKALAQKLAMKAAPEADVAEEVVRCMNESISQTRALARGLCPAELNGGGLVGGLEEFACGAAKRLGVSCRLEADKGIEVRDTSVASHLFRIAQEAVNNAVRHGNAKHIAIRLGRRGGQIALEIRDDGKGLPAEVPANRGMGFQTMRYRANAIGAQFSLTEGEGGGTVVTCVLPLSDSGSAATKSPRTLAKRRPASSAGEDPKRRNERGCAVESAKPIASQRSVY